MSQSEPVRKSFATSPTPPPKKSTAPPSRFDDRHRNALIDKLKDAIRGRVLAFSLVKVGDHYDRIELELAQEQKRFSIHIPVVPNHWVFAPATGSRLTYVDHYADYTIDLSFSRPTPEGIETRQTRFQLA